MELEYTTEELRREIAIVTNRLESLKAKLFGRERSCGHVWEQIKYDPINYPAHTSPGDPPGTMGVDWRGPTFIPASTTKQWSRTCQKCGKVETTQRTRNTTISGTIPGTVGQAQVPDFGDGYYQDQW